MIVLNLQCSNGHAFEGWFSSREAFEEQTTCGMVHCVRCASSAVTALPSGPRVLRHATGDQSRAIDPVRAPERHVTAVQSPSPELAAEVLRTLMVLARKAENVGTRFPEEARRIHYEEAPARTIRGVSTPEETMALIEEGIFVLPAPVPPEDELH